MRRFSREDVGLEAPMNLSGTSSRYAAGHPINTPLQRGAKTPARLKTVLTVCLLCLFLPFVTTAAEQLAIVPTNIVLTAPAARQQLVLEKIRDRHFAGQLTNQAEFISNDPGVVRIENAVALPVKNGQATITAKSGKQSVTVRATVQGVDKPFEWSFRNHVQPVLAKNGCSAGACHGAAAGQNGFKLSLRGYDDEGDFLTLTHGALGRRVVPSDPGRSLMLLKPS